mgnify:CR=1 FL=1
MSARVDYEREIGYPEAEAHTERVEAIRRGNTSDGEIHD